MERNAQRVVHGGVWPLWILTGEGETAGLHVIDWSATLSAAGAGTFLSKELRRLGAFACGAGLGPGSGFRQCQPTNMNVNNS